MKKRIAFFHGPMVIGGAEKALINLLDHMDYTKYDVTLWTFDPSGAMLSQVDQHVEIRYWGEHFSERYPRFALSLLRSGRITSLLDSLFNWILYKFSRESRQRASFQLKNRLLTPGQKYDAAILYQAFPGPYLSLFLALLDSPVRIGWLHGMSDTVFSSDEKKETRLLYEQFDYLVCVSEGVRDYYEQEYPELSEKFRVIYNLQNIPSILMAAQAPLDVPFAQTTLVTVGRLSAEKGQNMIPPAAKRLHEAGYRFLWYIVGDGPTRPTLEEAIRKWGMEEVVILTGARENPYPFIKNCSLYVQPSYREGFCVTTFEAKILQKPVVVTDVAGMREQFTEKTAYFAQPSVESLVKTIRKALDDGGAGPDMETVDEEFNRRELAKIERLLERSTLL